jgi:regulator of replication initiation timing
MNKSEFTTTKPKQNYRQLQANAELIRSSPELLEENESLKLANAELLDALRSIVNTHDFQQLTDTIVIKQAKSTIEKYKETL